MAFPSGGYPSVGAATTDGLVANLRLDESTVTTGSPIDDSINGSDKWNATVSGSGILTATPHVGAGAINFPDNSSEIIANEGDAVTEYSIFSISCWIKANSNTVSSGRASLMEITDDDSYNGERFSLSLTTAGYLEAAIENWGPDDTLLSTTSFIDAYPGTTGTGWHHVVYTKAFDDQTTLYVDGSLEDVSDGGSLYIFPWYLLELGIGNDPDFDMEDLGMWNREITSGEVTEIYNTGTGTLLLQDVETSPFERDLEENLETEGSTSFLTPVMHETIVEILDALGDSYIGNISQIELLESMSVLDLFSAPEFITVAESMTATDALTYTWYILRELHEAMETDDALPIPPYAKLLAETLLAASVPTSLGIFDRGLTEEMTMSDLFAIAWHKGLTETLNQSDSTEGLRRLIASLVETMYSSDVTTANRISDEVVGEALSLADACMRFFELIAAESLSIAHTQVVEAKFGNELVEAIEAADSATDNYGFSVVIAEEFTAADGATAGAILNHVIEEGMAFLNITPVINGGTYSGWVMNPETFSVWNYENYNFNSFATANNEVYAAATDGLYRISGSDDDGVDIESRLTTAAIDFGTKNLKQVPQVYLGMTSDGTIVLKVRVDNKYDVWYEATPVEDYQHTHMVKLGKGLVGRNWQFELVTKDNSSIDMESLEFYPVVFKRKR